MKKVCSVKKFLYLGLSKGTKIEFTSYKSEKFKVDKVWESHLHKIISLNILWKRLLESKISIFGSKQRYKDWVYFI